MQQPANDPLCPGCGAPVRPSEWASSPFCTNDGVRAHLTCLEFGFPEVNSLGTGLVYGYCLVKRTANPRILPAGAFFVALCGDCAVVRVPMNDRPKLVERLGQPSISAATWFQTISAAIEYAHERPPILADLSGV